MSWWQQQQLEERRRQEEQTGLEAHVHNLTGDQMKIGELTTSKFLKGSDFPKPALCTIGNVTKENVAKPNEPKKERGVMYFEEHEKGLVLNATNLKRAATA